MQSAVQAVAGVSTLPRLALQCASAAGLWAMPRVRRHEDRRPVAGQIHNGGFDEHRERHDPIHEGLEFWRRTRALDQYGAWGPSLEG